MKSRPRSTPYAVLGMLSLAPMSGYDIRKESETSIGYFWSESYGQLSPAMMQEQLTNPSLPFRRMPVGYGEHHSRSLIRWCRETRKALLALKEATRKEHAS